MSLLPSKTLRRDVVIEAPPEFVWRTLTDFDEYPSWNPFIRLASGQPVEGERLKVRLEPPGGTPMPFRPHVLLARPSQELRWLGVLGLPGIFDGEHWFRIEQEGEGRVRVTQGEDFRGILVPLFSRSLDRHTAAGFEAMNMALKARAEKQT